MPSANDDDFPLAEARANLYAILAASLASPPSQSILAVIASGGGGGGGNSRDEKSIAESLADFSACANRADAESLADEFQNLFIGLGRGKLVPFGSFYLTGFLMEKPLAILRADLESLGISRRQGVCEPEDHAASLCETMAILIRDSDAVSFARQKRFFERHLSPWLPQFFSDLEREAVGEFYRCAARLGGKFMQSEKQFFQMPF